MRGRRGRGRGRGRRAVRMLEPVVLLSLHYGPTHGYTLTARLEEFGLGELNPSVVYRALRNMEDRGWVSSTWEDEASQGPPRRVYSLTATGDSALQAWVRDLEQNRKLIDLLLAEYRRHMAEGEGEHHAGDHDSPLSDRPSEEGADRRDQYDDEEQR